MSDRSDLERDIAEENEIRSLLRAGDRDLVAPSVALIERRVQGRPPVPVFVGVAIAAVVVLAIAIGVGSRPVGAPVTSPSPSVLATPAPSAALPSASASAGAPTDAARAAAISRVTALAGEVLRVDFADAKLVRWSDFEAIAHSGSTGVDDRPVWVVAVSGEVKPQFAHGDTFASATFVVDAKTNDVLAETASSIPWPGDFALLREATGPRRPEPTVAFPQPTVPDNNVACGVLQPGSIATGEGSGADELRPAVIAAYGVMPLFRFGQPSSGRPAYGTYVCLRYRPGAPQSGLVAYVQPGDANYLPPSALIPTGFALPQGCRYGGQPTSELNADQVVWKVDCGAVANASARQNLGQVLTTQGWRACGLGPMTLSWFKDGRTLAITESSGATGDYPRLTLRPNTICGP
jgi:hypothetical protein